MSDSGNKIDIDGASLPRADWEATPTSVQSLVRVLLATNTQLQQQVVHLSDRVAHLEEQLRQICRIQPARRRVRDLGNLTPRSLERETGSGGNHQTMRGIPATCIR